MKSGELVYRYSGTYHNTINQFVVGETRNLKVASSVGEVQCASYSVTDSCQIYELAVNAKAEEHVETFN